MAVVQQYRGATASGAGAYGGPDATAIGVLRPMWVTNHAPRQTPALPPPIIAATDSRSVRLSFVLKRGPWMGI